MLGLEQDGEDAFAVDLDALECERVRGGSTLFAVRRGAMAERVAQLSGFRKGMPVLSSWPVRLAISMPSYERESVSDPVSSKAKSWKKLEE